MQIIKIQKIKKKYKTIIITLMWTIIKIYWKLNLLRHRLQNMELMMEKELQKINDIKGTISKNSNQKKKNN